MLLIVAENYAMACKLAVQLGLDLRSEAVSLNPRTWRYVSSPQQLYGLKDTTVFLGVNYMWREDWLAMQLLLYRGPARNLTVLYATTADEITTCRNYINATIKG